MTKKMKNTLLLIPTIMTAFVYGVSLISALCTHDLPYRIGIIIFSGVSLAINLCLIRYICKIRNYK